MLFNQYLCDLQNTKQHFYDYKFMKNSVTKGTELCVIIIIDFRYLRTSFASMFFSANKSNYLRFILFQFR